VIVHDFSAPEQAIATSSARKPLLISLAALLVAVAALAYIVTRSPVERALPPTALILAEYGFVYSLACAMTGVYVLASRKHWIRSGVTDFPGLILPVSLGIFSAVYKLGMHQFGGWDEGFIVHAGAFYADGFKPFIDFYCSLPPSFMAGIRAAVLLFGLRWASMQILAALFAAVISLWSFGLLRRLGMPNIWALAVTIAFQLTTSVAIPFWWFNTTSYLAAAVLILSVLVCLLPNAGGLAWASLAFSLAMVLTSKPNAGIACLAVAVLFATRDRSRWAKALVACAAATLLALLICRFAQMPPASVLQSYAEIGKLRGSPLAFFPFREMSRPMLAIQLLFLGLNFIAFLYCFVTCWRRHPEQWRSLLVIAVAGLTSLEMICTNSEAKYSDASILLLAISILFLEPWRGWKTGAVRRTVLVGLLAVSAASGGFFAAIDQRILGIGVLSFYEPLPTRTIQGDFFDGLEAGPRMWEVLAEVQQVLDQFPSEEKVFFGPRMEFGYAAFHRTVTRGLPLAWDTGNFYSPERLPYFLLNFQKEDPDLLIFLKNDYTRMESVGYYIQNTNTYERYEGFPRLSVYVRRKDVPIEYVKPPSSRSFAP
jgi:hypothetical protein